MLSDLLMQFLQEKSISLGILIKINNQLTRPSIEPGVEKNPPIILY